MILTLLAKAFLLGIVVTAPVGPVGALVIRRSLSAGLLMGVLTGLGAALADTLFAVLAALGMVSVEDFLIRYEFQLAIYGGLLLLVIGYFSLRKTLREHRKHEKLLAEEELNHELPAEILEEERQLSREKIPSTRYYRATAASFLITISNPITILGFAGSFAAFGLYADSTRLSHVLFVGAGVLAGAMAWWSGLALALHWMRGHLSKSWIFLMHLLSNGIIVASGLLCLMRGFLK